LIDDFNPEASRVVVDAFLPTERNINVLDQIITWRGKPSISSGQWVATCELQPNGMRSKASIAFTVYQTGWPQPNAYVERINSNVRHE
jgi:putative transposase